MKHDSKFEWFDLARGFAAMLVLFGHVRALLFLSYADSKPNLPGKVFFFITGFGHEAVVIFFVLSGFFIIRSIHESTEAGKWGAKQYAMNRISRLWTVLIPALVVSFAWDRIGLEFYHSLPSYRGEIPFMEGVSPVGKMSLGVFLGNIFFVQSIIVPTFGSNGALWSLANEFWYYALFPLLYFCVVQKYPVPIRLICLVLAAVIGAFLGVSVVSYFFIWLMGGAVFLIVKQHYNWATSNLYLVASMLLVVAILTGIRIKLIPSLFNDFSLGFATMMLLVALAGRTISNRLVKWISVSLSNISYTVYVVHLPLAVLLTSVLTSTRLTWSISSFAMYLLICATLLSYSVVMYFAFERNTVHVKKFISHLSNRYSHV